MTVDSGTTGNALEPRGIPLPIYTEPTVPLRESVHADMVQSPVARSEDGSHRIENLLVFFITVLGYAAVGIWLVTDVHVVSFESLDRLNRALMALHNDPAKLTAIGFDYPPLSVLVLTPFAVSSELARSLAALPIASALFAGVAAIALNSLLRRCRIPGPYRIAILLALAVNPLVIVYASTGSRQIVWVSLMLAGVTSVVKWFVTAQIRYILISGLTFSIAGLAGYGSLVWAILAAFLIGVVLQRQGARQAEVEGTVVGFASPVVYVIVVWTVFNAVILGNPFSWLTRSLSSVDETAGTTGADRLVEVLQDLGSVVLATSPLTIAVVPLLIFAAFRRRDELAGWLAVCIMAAIAAPGVSVFLRSDDSHVLMRDGLPVLVLTVAGACWLVRSVANGQAVGSVIVVLALLGSGAYTFHEMKDYPHQNLESSFYLAVTTGDSQEGEITAAGQQVGILSEQAMAGYIRRNVTTDGSILTDNSQTYAVMLLTGRPQLFFDRVDRGDGEWFKAANDPGKGVRYLLLSRSTADDRLSQIYPDAATGTDTALQPVYTTDRYVLVSVPDDYVPAGTASTDASSTEEGDTP